MNGQGIACVRNSYYSFIPILSKLHWCFGHDLMIGMWFGYNPQFFFVTFSKVEFSLFSSIFYNKGMDMGNLVGATPPRAFLPVFWSWSEDMHEV